MSKYHLRVIIGIVLLLLGCTLIFAPAVYQSCGTIFQKNVFWYLGDESFIIFGLAFLIIAVLLLISSYVSRRTKIVLFIIGVWILGVAVLSSLNSRDYKRPNSRKYFQVNALKLSLDVYYDQYGKYPLILKDLNNALNDPINMFIQYQVMDGKQYILKTIFEPNCHDSLDFNKYLSNDLDGTIFGLDCNDPAYCVSNDDEQIKKLQANKSNLK